MSNVSFKPDVFTDQLLAVKKEIFRLLSHEKAVKGLTARKIADVINRKYESELDVLLVQQILWHMATNDSSVWIHHKSKTGLAKELYTKMGNQLAQPATTYDEDEKEMEREREDEYPPSKPKRKKQDEDYI